MYGKFISRNIYDMLLQLFIQKHAEANYINILDSDSSKDQRRSRVLPSVASYEKIVQ